MSKKADIQFIDSLVKKYNLKREEGDRRELHDAITGMEYSHEEIEEIAKEIAIRKGRWQEEER